MKKLKQAINFFGKEIAGTVAELKQVEWLSRRDTVQSVSIVMLAAIATVIILSSMDNALTSIRSIILDRGII